MAIVATANAQANRGGLPAEKAASGKADQAEGARILADFRRMGIAGDYWLGFELRVMPRRGAERVVTATMLGTRGPQGPLFRLNVDGQQWLIESGPRPSAWRADPSAEAIELPGSEAGTGIADTGFTVFDLQMPFLYWTDFVYEGEARVRGRPTHSFVLRPPAGQPAPVPGLTGVRVLIDIQFGALVQAEQLGPNDFAEKTVSLLDLKKVGDQWMMKAIDVRNNRTRDKTRFQVTAAALKLDLPLETFTPDKLDQQPPAVSPDKIVRF